MRNLEMHLEGEGVNTLDIYSKVNGLSLQNLFYLHTRRFPNCYMFSSSRRESDYYFDTDELLKKIIEHYGEDKILSTVYTSYDFENKEERKGVNIIIEEKGIYSRVENDVTESYVLYDYEKEKELGEFLEILKSCYTAPKVEANNLYTIQATDHGYMLNKLKVKKINLDIDKQYNDEFKKEAEKISKFVAEDDKSGLVILHGEKGTGKSSYIKKLINDLPTRKFIFVQNAMLSLLDNPTFSTFLSSLHDSVIILEDCENVIKSRKGNMFGNSGVATILNLTDGLLSDGLGIKFICTFNEDVSNIDDALMRKGRLVSKYEFGLLSVEKSNALLAELYPGENITTDIELSLADIYNYKDDSYISERKRII